MTANQTLQQVINRLAEAVSQLETVAEARMANEHNSVEIEAEVQRMNADRGRLAEELDSAQARAERLRDANKEVSRRLVTAMETIRAVLDR